MLSFFPLILVVPALFADLFTLLLCRCSVRNQPTLLLSLPLTTGPLTELDSQPVAMNDSDW
jgi:hypothetical protein